MVNLINDYTILFYILTINRIRYFVFLICVIDYRLIKMSISPSLIVLLSLIFLGEILIRYCQVYKIPLHSKRDTDIVGH